jgi:hypothetical protein
VHKEAVEANINNQFSVFEINYIFLVDEADFLMVYSKYDIILTNNETDIKNWALLCNHSLSSLEVCLVFKKF